jgi:hypothetical protein
MKQTISPGFLYFYGLVVHSLSLIVISLLFKIVLELGDYVVILIVSLFFSMALFLFLKFINRQIYLCVIDKKEVEYRSLLFSGQVSVENVSGMKRIFTNLYKVNISGKKYYFYSSTKSIKILEELINT